MFKQLDASAVPLPHSMLFGARTRINNGIRNALICLPSYVGLNGRMLTSVICTDLSLCSVCTGDLHPYSRI